MIVFHLREGETFIPLIQLLKITGIAESGAQAQRLVEENKVLRNGEKEFRKRAKITVGERIEAEGKIIEVAEPQT